MSFNPLERGLGAEEQLLGQTEKRADERPVPALDKTLAATRYRAIHSA